MNMSSDQTRSNEFNTPVLLLVYNRPHQVERIVDELKGWGVKQIFISSDGPKNNKKDKQKVQQVRDQLKKLSQVKILEHKQNLGCQAGVRAGINWFFSHVEKGIIIESDLQADSTFFPYAQELLSKFHNDERVMSISGANLHPTISKNIKESYFFSKHAFVWGWATWRSSWALFEEVYTNRQTILADTELWKDLKQTHLAPKIDVIRAALEGTVDSWAYIWSLAHALNSALCAVPHTNLVTNKGFEESASHTKIRTAYADMPTQSLKFPLTHPTQQLPLHRFENTVANDSRLMQVLLSVIRGHIAKYF